MNEFIISILVFSIFVILCLPLDWLFSRRNLQKLIKEMEVNNLEICENKSSLLWKIHNISYKLFNAMNIKLNYKKYEKYKNKIILADLNSYITVEGFYGFKILSLIISLFYFLLLFFLKDDSLMFLLLILGPFIAFNCPDAIINSKIRKRQWQMQVELPSILNTLAIVTDAGLNLTEAIKKICETRKGVLVDELKKVIDEVNMGILQRDAFLRMAERCQVYDITTFLFAITQSLEKGSSGIVKMLKEQSKEVWNKRKDKARELGEKASMKLFLPMLMLVFPCLLIFLIGPAVLSIIQQFR